MNSAPRISTLPLQHVDRIEEWISEARLVDDGSTIFRKGIANLETLINSVIPKQSVLLPNFPTPLIQRHGYLTIWLKMLMSISTSTI